MTKILNLDKLSAKEARELVIDGVSYPVKEMSVDDFIETSIQADKLSGDKNIVNQLNATIDLLMLSLPTIPRETLSNLSMEQLSALTAFVRGEDPEKIMADAEAAQAQLEADPGVEGKN